MLTNKDMMFVDDPESDQRCVGKTHPFFIKKIRPQVVKGPSLQPPFQMGLSKLKVRFLES